MIDGGELYTRPIKQTKFHRRQPLAAKPSVFVKHVGQPPRMAPAFIVGFKVGGFRSFRFAVGP